MTSKTATQRAVRAPRSDAADKRQPRGRRENRHEILLDSAVRLFAERGYDGTSMRDIAEAAGMLAGSIYYHYKSKEELLQAAYDRVGSQYKAAMAAPATVGLGPWDRLEAACIAHLNAVLTMPSIGRIFTLFSKPEDNAAYRQVVGFREEHEESFRKLIDELPADAVPDRKFFRLTLLGALNYVTVWYHPGGDDPARIAKRILAVFRRDATSGVDAKKRTAAKGTPRKAAGR